MASVATTSPPGEFKIEVDVLAAILALQVQQLHHDFVGIARVDLTLEKHNAVLQQQIAQGQLPLPLVRLVGIRIHDRSRKRSAHAIWSFGT